MTNLSSPVLEEHIHGKQPDIQNPYEKYAQLQTLHNMLAKFGGGPVAQKHLDRIDNLCRTACNIAVNTRG